MAGYELREGKSDRVLVTRIKPENDLLQTLDKIVRDNKIEAGVILSGVGLLGDAKLRNCKMLPNEYPITDENRTYLSFNKPLEILGISGDVFTVDNKPTIHAHITLSYVIGEKIGVIGGHLIEGCKVFGFAEIIIMELINTRMDKNFDEEIKTLQLLREF